jgi:cytochrome c oxidase assembly factor CtaG
VTWWCSATDAPWTWTWRAYPGVWLFVGLVVVGLYLVRRRVSGPGMGVSWGPRRVVALGAGVLALWLALDWPVGALGAGYLLAVHTAQYLLLDFVAAPLLLLGVPPEAWRRLAKRPGPDAVLRRAAHPLVGLLVYNLIVIVSHLPGVVDGLMRLQLGSFVVDLAWLTGGLALWWPVLAPAGISRVSPPAKLGYLFASTLLPTVPAAFLTFADYPIYSLYELAPRLGGIEAHDDQQLAGILMKLAADPVIWLAMGIIFFRWSSEQAAADRAEAELRLRSPASGGG